VLSPIVISEAERRIQQRFPACVQEFEDFLALVDYQTAPLPTVEVAEAVLYQSMRAGLLQQALDRLATEQGMEAPRVVTPERFLEMLEQRQEEEEHGR
jgi:hypothetical protein